VIEDRAETASPFSGGAVGADEKPGQANQSGTTAGMKSCRYCGSEMLVSATLCPTCKFFQNRFRNFLTYLAGTAAFLALVVSATAFTAGKVSDMIKERAWQDKVGVGYFKYPGSSTKLSEGEILLLNSGDGDVFVTDIIIAFQNGNMGIPINALVGKGEGKRVPLQLVESPLMPVTPGNASWIANASGAVHPNTLREAFEDRDNKCVHPILLTMTHSDFTRMAGFYREFRERLATVAVTATLNAYSIHTGKPTHESVQDVVMGFAVMPIENCESQFWAAEPEAENPVLTRQH
jgi:hypothetical protein